MIEWSRCLKQSVTFVFSSWGFLSYYAICLSCCLGTDRFYGDISVKSPGSRYQVEAKSPDNAPELPGVPKKRTAFQSKFVYTCTEVGTENVLWTRQQPENEGSPSSIFLTDDAWTVVLVHDELICLDPEGQERGRVDILDQFTQKERANYVHHTTAGPMWAGKSLWYFVSAGHGHFFAIRPWWGGRIIIDVENGLPLQGPDEFETACLKQERNDVLFELTQAVETRKEWESKGDCPCVESAYLAGALKIKASVPLLKQLEDCEYSGRSSSSSQVRSIEGRVNPFNHSVFSLRQAVQLSLRRLGETPRSYPATEFDIEYDDFDKHRKFVPPILTVPRHENAKKVRLGMEPESVLSILGEPDFVDDSWEYDMDSTPPSTLVLSWGQPLSTQLGLTHEGPAQVTWIQRLKTPSWAKGQIRDRQIAE